MEGWWLVGGSVGGGSVWKYNTPPLSLTLLRSVCLGLFLMLPGKFEVWLKAEI